MNSSFFFLPRPARIIFVFSATALLMGGWFQASAETLVGSPIQVPLTVGKFNEKTQDYRLMRLATRYVQALRGKPSQIKSEPSLNKPTYYSFTAGKKEIFAILDVSSTVENAKLYIDFDGQGDFSSSKSFDGVDQCKNLKTKEGQSLEYANFEFGPIEFPKGAESASSPEVMVSCIVFKDRKNIPCLDIASQKYVSGKLRLGADEYAVSFADGALAGSFESSQSGVAGNSRQQHQNGRLMMAIDLGKNGQFDARGEVFPFRSLVRINEKYYHISLKPDGSAAEFQEAKPDLGELNVKSPSMEMFVLSDQCAALLKANAGGKWELPVGKYALENFALIKEEGTTKWTLSSSQSPDGNKNFEIKSETPKVLELGAPLNLRYSVDKISKPSNSSVVETIGLEVLGKGGETYAAGALKNGMRDAAPKFVILSETGEKVGEGEFEYG